MIERDWLDPEYDERERVQWIQDRATARKLRLFSSAACRVIERFLAGDEVRQLIDSLEQCADGTLEGDELRRISAQADQFAQKSKVYHEVFSARTIAVASDDLNFAVQANNYLGLVYCQYRSAEEPAKHLVVHSLLRDIFGNPFRPSRIDQTWLTWRDRTIPALAQAAYDDRDLPSGHLKADKLAILADALEEAGCNNADILGHLRGPGPHVRGCWVVDLLLGKE